MKKIILTIIGIVILVGIISFTFINFYSFDKVGEELAIDMWAIKYPDKYEKYESIKCSNFWSLNPEYAFVNKRPERNNKILFYIVNTTSFFTQKYNFKYTGGTTVKNTTFENLLKMVKEDCSQFQINGKKDNITWVYMKYDAEKERIRKSELNESEREFIVDTLQFTEEEVQKYEKLNTKDRENTIREGYKKLNLPKLSDEQIKKDQEEIDRLLQEILDEQ